MSDFRVSTHDRGAFGELLGPLKAAGCHKVHFHADLQADGEDYERWTADVLTRPGLVRIRGNGRTGEEALRRLVELVESTRPAA